MMYTFLMIITYGNLIFRCGCLTNLITIHHLALILVENNTAIRSMLPVRMRDHNLAGERLRNYPKNSSVNFRKINTVQ